MAKTIAIYFSDSEPMGYPFNKKQYWEIYQQIIAQIEERGVVVVIARGDSYRGNGNFAKGWRLRNGEVKEINEPIHADLIFNRDDKNTIPEIEDCPMVNQLAFDKLCVDKFQTYEAFPDMSPRTALAHSYQEYCSIRDLWKLSKDERVVLKKNYEGEGRGIFIQPSGEITEALYDDWRDILVQEFLDGSLGIPGVVEGLHDLRIANINGTPINAYIRVPKKGSLFANIARGGRGFSLDLSEVPDEVMTLVAKINDNVSQYFPSVYAADFIRTVKGYKLIELNSRVAVQHPDWSKSYKKFNNILVDMLVAAVN